MNPEHDLRGTSALTPPPHPVEAYDEIEAALTDAYIIKGVLGAGAMSVLFGPSNSGKTFVALDMSFHIATETPWQGRRVKKCAVLYLAAEGGRGVQNRIAALKRKHGGVVDVPLYVRRAGLDLLRSNADLQSIVDLVNWIKRKHPGLPIMIVVDTLSRVIAGGDENSPQDMTALIRNLDAIREHTGAHIMIVHHTGKEIARGARGHSSLRAAADTEIEVIAEDGIHYASVQKQRDYEGGQTFAFKLVRVVLGHDQDGDEVVSCVIDWEDAADAIKAREMSKGLGGNQKLVADTFDQLVAEGLGMPNPAGVGGPDPGLYWCLDRDLYRKICRGQLTAVDTKSAFNQAVKALVLRGLFAGGENLICRMDRKIQ
jgi:hypothetical protein